MSARLLAGTLIVLLLASTGWAVPPLPTVTHDGRSYVELTRLAASIQTKGSSPAKVVATPASTRAQLRAGGKVVTLTRNWAQVLVDGKPVLLDAPLRGRRGPARGLRGHRRDHPRHHPGRSAAHRARRRPARGSRPAREP